MGSFSIWHWLLVLLIIVLIFGTRKLKDLGKDLGEAIRNFKHAVNDEKKTDEAKEIDKKIIDNSTTKNDDTVPK